MATLVATIFHDVLHHPLNNRVFNPTMTGDNDQYPDESGAQSADYDDSPLRNIVDDTEERAECREWIYREFVAGRDADALLEELVAGGWPTGDAEAMVEEGRRATRHLRGVVTREQVARVAEARYRSSMNIAPKLAAGGLIWVGIHFLLSMTTFMRIPWPTRRRAKRED